MDKLFVGYYRVSTQDQGKSGLGLDAQRRSVMDYVGVNGILVDEFTDIESGASNSREGIQKAIQACKIYGATLVVKEMSRISRGGFKIMVELEEAGINFIESTAPFDPSMVKGLKFVLAKEEREKISERTTVALSEIKSKLEKGHKHYSKAGRLVTSLGNPENLTEKARVKSIQVRMEKAHKQVDNVKAGAFIVMSHKSGNSFYDITKQLNKAGFKTSRGSIFSQTQTKRLYDRYSA